MVLDQLSSIMGAELLGKEVVPDFIDNQQVGMVANFTQHFVNQTNLTVHNHTKHLTGLYTHDGHKVQVQKDRSDEEDDTIISTEILCMIFLVAMAISSGHFLKRSKHKYL